MLPQLVTCAMQLLATQLAGSKLSQTPLSPANASFLSAVRTAALLTGRRALCRPPCAALYHSGSRLEWGAAGSSGRPSTSSSAPFRQQHPGWCSYLLCDEFYLPDRRAVRWDTDRHVHSAAGTLSPAQSRTEAACGSSAAHQHVPPRLSCSLSSGHSPSR